MGPQIQSECGIWSFVKKTGPRSGHFDIKEAKNKSMVVEIWLLALTSQKSRAEKLQFQELKAKSLLQKSAQGEQNYE